MLRKILGGLALATLLAAPVANAQEAWLELLRSDLKTQKVAIVTEVMMLTDAESEVFWPIYRDYEHELSKLGDERIALIKDYAMHFDNMTEEKAKELMNTAFKQDEAHLKLLKKYNKRFAKDMDAVTAARFVQVENQIGLLIDLQVALEMPLMERAAEVVEGDDEAAASENRSADDGEPVP